MRDDTFDPVSGTFSFPRHLTPEHHRYHEPDALAHIERDASIFLAGVSRTTLALDLHQKTFDRCIFTEVDFSNAALEETTFIACIFIRCRFHGNLRSCTFTLCDFGSETTPRHCAMAGAAFLDTAFHSCDFYRYDFANVTIATSTFERCRLTHADFSRAILQRRVGRETSYTGLRMISCICAHASFEGAELTGADLSDSNLTQTNFTRANLSDCDLRGAVLDATIVKSALLDGADLRGATMDDLDILSALSWYRAKVNADQTVRLAKALGFSVVRSVDAL